VEDGLRRRHPQASAAIALGGLIPVLVIASVNADGRILDPLTLVLVAGAAASNITDVRFEGRLWVSGSFLCCLLAAAVLGPSAGAFVALSSELVAWIWNRFALAPLAINSVGAVVPTWLAGVGLAALTPYVGTEGLDFDVALVAVACLDLAANIAIVSSLMALHEDLPLMKHVAAYRRLLPFLGANVVLLVAVTEAYQRVGIAAASFLIVVMLVFTFVVRLFVDARERVNEIEKLSTSRGRLVAEAVNAEDRARRELASRLHDDALQALLAARQDLEDATEGDAYGVVRAEAAIRETVDKLRDAVFELHPSVLEHAGLEQAILAVAEENTRRAGLELHVRIDPEISGLSDHLVFSLIRELVTNVTKHAKAANVWIRAERDQQGVAVSVRDDGQGFRGIDRSDAIRTGHIGLASSEERVDALGGEFRLQTAPGLGTDVRIWIPLSALEQVRLTDARTATPATPDA
jgi:signal transduction histidine kinase